MNTCNQPVWKKGKGLILDGHCGLKRGHDGKCMLHVETKRPVRRSGGKQLDLDISDPYDEWKLNKDLPTSG